MWQAQLIQYVTCGTAAEQWASYIKGMCGFGGISGGKECGRKTNVPE